MHRVDDLAVGAAQMTCRGPSCPFGGDVSVFYGSTRGLVSTGSQRWSKDSPLRLGDQGRRFRR